MSVHDTNLILHHLEEQNKMMKEVLDLMIQVKLDLSSMKWEESFEEAVREEANRKFNDAHNDIREENENVT